MTNCTGKILVVDSDEHGLEFLDQVLRRENHSVVKARDGVEALDRFQKYQPDLVIMDLLIPRLNGYDVCARLKQNSLSQAVPILMITATESDVRTIALRSGADDFITKPVEPSLLTARVRSLLRLRFGLQSVARLHTARAEARTELAKTSSHLDQIQSHLHSQPDPHIAELATKALASCKRLDQVLARL